MRDTEALLVVARTERDAAIAERDQALSQNDRHLRDSLVPSTAPYCSADEDDIRRLTDARSTRLQFRKPQRRRRKSRSIVHGAWYGRLHELYSGVKYDRCRTNNAHPWFVAQTKGNPRSEKNESSML